MRGSGAEQRLLRGCSGAVALRAVCPAQITAGVPDYAVGPPVAEKPVGRLPKDLGQPPRPPTSLAAAHSVIRNASGREVLDLNKDTVVVMSNVPHLRNEEDLRKGAKKLLVAGVEAQCYSGRGLTVHH